MRSEKKDVFQEVTDHIVSAIEAGAPAYRMPWKVTGGVAQSPINAVSRKPYRGINVLVLWAAAQKRGFTSGTWATYRQWEEIGAQVRKGEKSTHVVFWKFFDIEEATGETSKRIPMARDYWVFNADQVANYAPSNEEPSTIGERIDHAEELFRSLKIDIRPGGNQAYYDQHSDAVYMPGFDSFKEPLSYYSVLSHESTHWSGAATRLNRDLKGRFGTESYAMEELVAELGAAFLCATIGIPTDPRTDHAPYIASWLKALKNDKRAIFTAAAKAQEAVDWMTNSLEQAE